ncbi:MAG TPA: hypothetical protein VKF17_06510, partial [Isosphaeraceae bacterium]|nr:hypothetical protein [Isosphaeraceae bacterium]
MSLTEARPPAVVAADFFAAQSAETQRDRRGNQARTRAETTVTAARATAGSRLEAARAASQCKLLGSRAGAQRFLALLAEARRAPELTAQRIYLDTMKALLGRVRRKIVLPPGDSVDLTVLGIEERCMELGVEQAEAAVKKARSNLAQAHAQVQAQLGQARGNWFRRKNAQERIRQQLATLRSDVAALRARESSLWLAQASVLRPSSAAHNFFLTKKRGRWHGGCIFSNLFHWRSSAREGPGESQPERPGVLGLVRDDRRHVQPWKGVLNRFEP